MNTFLSLAGQQQLILARNSEALLSLNAMTENYGLRLSPAEAAALTAEEQRLLTGHGRIALSSILPAIVDAFCDSPYLLKEDYPDTLALLADTFYALKNEADNRWEDEELLAMMRDCYDHAAQGDLDFMAEVTLGELERRHMLRNG